MKDCPSLEALDAAIPDETIPKELTDWLYTTIHSSGLSDGSTDAMRAAAKLVLIYFDLDTIDYTRSIIAHRKRIESKP